MYYIFNSHGELIATSDFTPNTDDLMSRGEQAVETEQNFINPLLVDGKIVERGEQPSSYHTWDGVKWAISAEQQAVKKAEDIAKVREQINALRDRKINGGVYVKEVDKWLDTDATAERNLLAVKATFDLFGEAAGEIAWTCADNSILTINKDTLLVIWQAMMAAKTGNHANAMRHKAALELADDPLAYDYSDGWTQCYQDHLKEQGNG